MQKLQSPAAMDLYSKNNNSSTEEIKSGNDDHAGGGDTFVAVNISQLQAAANWDPTASPRNSVKALMKSASRKGSQWSGGGGATAAVDAVGGPGGGREPGHALAGGESGGETRPLPVGASAAEEGRWRRAASGRRPSTPWCDPRRVLFVFASLSCMGTLILIYFTISMSKQMASD